MKPTKITTAMPFALAAGLLFTNGCADKPVDIDGATEIESALTVPVAPVINKKYCTSVIGGVCNNWQPGGNYGGSTVCDLENGPVWLGHVNFYTNPIANDMSNGGKCAEWHAREQAPWSDDAYSFGWYNRRYSSTPTDQVNFAIRSMWVAHDTWVQLCDSNYSTCQYYESPLPWGNGYENIPIGLGYHVSIGYYPY